MSGSGGNDIATTDRLCLRLLAESDENLYCGLYTDAATMRFIGAPLSRERAARSFRKVLRLTHHLPCELLFATIFEKNTLQAIGVGSVRPFDERARQAEAGIILQPAGHARGVGKEAFAALITQGFAMFQIDEIQAHISLGNLAAQGMVAGLGFVCCGDGGAAQEHLQRRVWSVDRDDWCRKLSP